MTTTTRQEVEHNLSVSKIDPKRVQKMQTIVPTVLSQAKDMAINSNEDYETAGSLLDVILRRQTEVAEMFDKPCKDAFSVHKFLTGIRAGLLSPLQQAESLLRDRRKLWRAKVEQLRLNQQNAAREAAKKEQDEQAIKEAASLHAIGETEAAETIIERAATAPAPPVNIPSSLPEEKGKSLKYTWKYKEVNPALVKREFLMLDEKKINAVVSKLGPDAVAIVGAGSIEVYEEETEIIRRK